MAIDNEKTQADKAEAENAVPEHVSEFQRLKEEFKEVEKIFEKHPDALE